MTRSIATFAIFFSLTFIACSLPPAKVKVPAPASTEGGATQTGIASWYGPGFHGRPTAAPVSTEGGATQTGIASWYGPGFHGRPTASGVIYNQNELTAAHQTLPLGTRVMVTNLDNGRSAEVTINDRGPFAKGRIVDLSYAAARTLGMIGPGTIPVRIEVIDSGPYRIQSIRPSLDYTL
ncbi:MAG: septal ring lytic transglycosylase RlpA family protein, partial [Deltaproteobacteria bacterium]|nr:septal ring lytic transglycosylase RlpA family protein [Deltaproteobacteria bacterium]